jgi:hypothetical protein
VLPVSCFLSADASPLNNVQTNPSEKAFVFWAILEAYGSGSSTAKSLMGGSVVGKGHSQAANIHLYICYDL